MCKTVPICTTIVLSLFFTACSRNDPKLIMPGERVGKYRVHQPRSEIQGGDDLKSYAVPISEGLLLSFAGERVSIISVASPDYCTERGLKPGSLVEEVREHFGEPGESDGEGYMGYPKLGIDFQCKDGRVGLSHVYEKNKP